MKIRTVEGDTKSFPVSEGVLQGELISPLLFALYISDIDDIFKTLESQGIRGISVNHQTSIHILAYADDLVILAESARHLQEKLKVLHEYCKGYDLTVNVSKTKILIFNHCHPSADYVGTFMYDGKAVQVVREFTYLGVTFCECGRFHKHFYSIRPKIAAAAATITAIILKSKTQSWDAVLKMFKAMLLSIPFYGCEIFGPENVEEIEKLQLTFLKRLLHLPKYTPGYMLRIETGVSHTSAAVLKRATRFFQKIKNQDSSRYPYLCQAELVQLHRQNPNVKSNWISTLLEKLAKFDLVVYDPPLQIFNGTTEVSVEETERKISECYFQLDLDRCENSTFSSFYHRIKYNPHPEPYLIYPVSFHRKRLF